MTPAREREGGREGGAKQQESWQNKLRDEESEITLHLLLLRSYIRHFTKYEVSFSLSHTFSECHSNETECLRCHTEHPTTQPSHCLPPPMLPWPWFIPAAASCTHKHFPSIYSTHTITLKTAADLFSLLTNSQCSVSADKLIPIIFKYSSGGSSSRSSLFSTMLSAPNIVYSICTRADRRLLWSVLFFKQSISDTALFSWDRVIFLHWPRNITPTLMESRCRHPYPPRFE